MEKTIFKNFAEYWFYAKCFTINQRDIILSNLPEKQREKLIKSYKEGGWEDLAMRNEIDKIIDSIKEKMGIDLLQIRCKIFSGKAVYIKKEEWEYISNIFKPFQNNHTNYILGGIGSENIDNQTTLLVKSF
jgi:hypothetical protein